MSELVHVAVDETIATVTLQNPDKMGALSIAAMRELTEAFDSIADRHDVHVVILASEGKVFSAGHDLSEVHGADEATQRVIFETCTELMLTITNLPQPVIAKVHGLATAAGCQLVATCDLAVAGASARFATPGVRIGLFCSTPMVAISRAVGRKMAMRMLLTGEPIAADEALTHGLVSHVAADDALDTTVQELAQRVAQASAATVTIGKRAFYDQIDLPAADAYAMMSEVMTTNALTHDAQEGIGAFLEKREPMWQHHNA